MTDKKIIDYKNLCVNYSKEVGCYNTFDGCCIKEQCFTYRLLQSLQSKEQECKKLKKQLFSFMNGDYCANGCSLKQQLDKLKLENDKLTKECEIWKNQVLTLDDEMITVQITLRQFEQDDKLKNCLAKIKEIAEKENNDTKVLYNRRTYQRMKQILQKISEVKNERN